MTLFYLYYFPAAIPTVFLRFVLFMDYLLWSVYLFMGQRRKRSQWEEKVGIWAAGLQRFHLYTDPQYRSRSRSFWLPLKPNRMKNRRKITSPLATLQHLSANPFTTVADRDRQLAFLVPHPWDKNKIPSINGHFLTRWFSVFCTKQVITSFPLGRCTFKLRLLRASCEVMHNSKGAFLYTMDITHLQCKGYAECGLWTE